MYKALMKYKEDITDGTDKENQRITVGEENE